MQNQRTLFTVPGRSFLRYAAGGALLILVVAAPVLCQTTLPPVADTTSLSGPRFGLTFLSAGVVEKLEERQITISRPYVAQFGWQFEKQFYARDSGVTMVTEWVALVGGSKRASSSRA